MRKSTKKAVACTPARSRENPGEDVRLVVEQVIKTFGQKPAVDNISLEVGGPAMIGVIDRNPVAARTIRDAEAAAS